MTTIVRVQVHPADAEIEQIIDDFLLGRVPFIRSDSGHDVSGTSSPVRFDEGSTTEEDLATAHGR